MSRKDWASAGLCYRCGSTPGPGRKTCDECLSLHKQYRAVTLRRKRGSGTCLHCSSIATGGTNHCDKHRAVKMASWKSRYKGMERVKILARVSLQAAVREGKIDRPKSCSRCHSRTTPHGHHTDYSKPLDVVWLCRPCDVAEHIAIAKQGGAK